MRINNSLNFTSIVVCHWGTGKLPAISLRLQHGPRRAAAKQNIAQVVYVRKASKLAFKYTFFFSLSFSIYNCKARNHGASRLRGNQGWVTGFPATGNFDSLFRNPACLHASRSFHIWKSFYSVVVRRSRLALGEREGGPSKVLDFW